MRTDAVKVDEIRIAFVVDEEIACMKISVTGFQRGELVNESKDFRRSGRVDRQTLIDGIEEGGVRTELRDERNGMAKGASFFKKEERFWGFDSSVAKSNACSIGSVSAGVSYQSRSFVPEGFLMVGFGDELAVACLEAMNRLVFGFVNECSACGQVVKSFPDFRNLF